MDLRKKLYRNIQKIRKNRQNSTAGRKKYLGRGALSPYSFELFRTLFRGFLESRRQTFSASFCRSNAKQHSTDGNYFVSRLCPRAQKSEKKPLSSSRAQKTSKKNREKNILPPRPLGRGRDARAQETGAFPTLFFLPFSRAFFILLSGV